MQLRTCLLAAAVTAGLSAFASADVTGKVTLQGKAPEAKPIDMSGVKECADQHADPVYEETVVADENGNLANVVVSVKTDDPAALGGEAPKQPAVLDQKGCQYVPHVLPMMVGQDLVIKNDDPFLHNVHSLSQTNPSFNFGQPNKDPGKKVDTPPKAPETIKVKCDVHPWMSAWIVVLDNPFFASSGEDGAFAIKGLPDGDYTLQAWHEKYGTQEQQITVKDGKTEQPVEFKFKAESASAEPAHREAQLAAVKEAAGAASCCGNCQDKEARTAKAE